MGVKQDTQLMGMQEICRYVGRCERVVRQWIRHEGFPAVKLGGEWISDTGLIILWRRDRIKNAKGVRNGEDFQG